MDVMTKCKGVKSQKDYQIHVNEAFPSIQSPFSLLERASTKHIYFLLEKNVCSACLKRIFRCPLVNLLLLQYLFPRVLRFLLSLL
jgi:hypothetical protein